MKTAEALDTVLKMAKSTSDRERKITERNGQEFVRWDKEREAIEEVELLLECVFHGKSHGVCDDKEHDWTY